jgi:hypothetical protein
MMDRPHGYQAGGATLVDILDRVLDRGLVVAGDIRVSIANVELLTIQIRLLVCSIDKAEEIGLDWWRRDSFLSSKAGQQEALIDELRDRVRTLEQQLSAPAETPQPSTRRPGQPRRRTAQ